MLVVLWREGRPMSPRDVLDRLDADLAYTTVTTVLTRLWQKGLADRSRVGKSFVYAATASEEAQTAQQMEALLRPLADRHAALASFVDRLDPRDLAILRAALEQRDGR